MNILILVNNLYDIHDSKSFEIQQTRLVAQQNPDLQFYVCGFGGNDYGISFSTPIHGIKNFLRAFRFNFKKIENNITFISQPTLNIYRLGYAFNRLRKLRKLFNVIEDLKKVNITLDLIHAHFTHEAGSLAYEVSKKYSIPYVITEHSGPFPFRDQLLIKGNGELTDYMFNPLKMASKIIAVSKFQQEEIQKHGFFQVEYVPNFIDENFFQMAEPKKKEGFRFVSIGILSPQKGFDPLIDAFANFSAISQSNAVLEIIGGGNEEYLNRLKQKASELGVLDKVFFRGNLQKQAIRDSLAQADCFVLASRHESFGIVAVEAMACGLPLIGTRCGGLETIIANDKIGILVDIDDHHGLSKAMQNMYDNIDQYSKIYLRDFFMDNFSSKAVVSQLMAVYENVIKTGQKLPAVI